MAEVPTVTETTASPSPLHKSQGMEESMPKLSEEARKKISDAVRKSWAARRAQQGGAILSAVEQAAKALRKATVEDIRPLAGQRAAARQLDELASLASELKRLINA